MHIRRGTVRDSVFALRPYIKRVTTIKNILRNLDKHPDINRNSVIYLMTDEPDPQYFDELNRAYINVLTYRDFPQLKALLTEIGNNFLLYCVEREIMLFAGLQIQSNRHFPSGYYLRDYHTIRFWGKTIPLPYRSDLTATALYNRLPRSIKRAYKKLRHR